jgi:DNA-directed RNA polymerase specialized sigma24 family protein
MDVKESVTRLIGLAKAGETDVVGPLWHAYFQKLVAVARNKLATAPRAVADEEDVALSAFKSFWNGVRQDRFPQLTDRTSLWPLLVAITSHKCVDLVRHQTRAKRSGGASTPTGLDEVVTREPGPDAAAQVADQLAGLLDCLDRTGDPQLRKVAELRLHGHTADEIGAALGCAKRTVERKLGVVERCWAAEVFDDSTQ